MLHELRGGARELARNRPVRLLVGLFAALRYGRPELVPALKEGGRGGTVGPDGGTRGGELVVAVWTRPARAPL